MKLLKDIMKNQLSENASVLIIGNEILSGRTIDKNFNFIASKLNEHGISISESRTVSDNEQEIINAINIFKIWSPLKKSPPNSNVEISKEGNECVLSGRS